MLWCKVSLGIALAVGELLLKFQGKSAVEEIEKTSSSRYSYT